MWECFCLCWKPEKNTMEDKRMAVGKKQVRVNQREKNRKKKEKKKDENGRWGRIKQLMRGKPKEKKEGNQRFPQFFINVHFE